MTSPAPLPPIETLIAAALTAGEAILAVYAEPIDAAHKADGSPVTLADERAEALILAALAPLGLPVLAEESVASGHVPEIGQRFFVVDPLDGTKEFLKRNGEFTVNIALVEAGAPVMGVVTAPALGRGYAGGPQGAFRFDIDTGQAGPMRPIAVDRAQPMRVVASRSHGHAALAGLCDALAVREDVSVGSSLKFCLLAEGAARLYPRFTPTCEWDTAAGQAVLEAAGGAVLRLDGSPLTYGKAGDAFYNPFFVAADDADLAARAATEMRAVLARV